MSGARIQLKRSTAASWTSNNPVLYVGEIGYETDTKKIKVGDGTTAWTSLAYSSVPLSLATLNDLGDVTISSAANGDFLRWNGTAWVNDAVDLATDTTGSFVQSLVAGTGITLTNNSGENSTPTIAVTTNTFDAFGAASTAASNAATALSNHEADTTNIHGIADTSILVTTTGTQTLTNKTITSPSGLVKGDVGLGSVDNTADTAKPVSTAQQTALDLKANLASPTFTGTVTVPAPTNATDAATKAYADAIAAGINWHESVELATATALPNSPTYNNGTSGVGSTLTATTNGRLSVDGVNATTGDRILVKDQVTATQNGIYVVTAQGSAGATYLLTRATDHDGANDDIVRGDAVYVGNGSSNINQGFLINSVGSSGAKELHVVGTDNITFTQFTGTSNITAGTGITKTGNTLSIGQSVATDASVTFAQVTAALVGNATTATTLQTARNIAGQSFNGSANISIAPTDLTGVTATAAQINILNGATLSTTELNYVDGVTSAIQTQLDAKAPLASPTFTGTVSGITSTMVGLGNVDNTSNATERAAIATLTNKTLTSPVINTPTGIVKGDVGLGSVDNTADTAKPVSTAQQTALDLKANLASPTFTGTVTIPTGASITAPTGLVKGDVGLGNVDNTSNATERAATATLTNKTLTSPVINTPTGIVKGDVGLGNVDNTSDASKPVSTATQTALDLKANLNSPTFTGTVTLPDNTVALGTKTTGDYVATITGGTGVTSSAATSGEGTTHSLSIGQAVATTDNVTFAGVTADAIKVGVTAANEIDTVSGDLTIDSAGGTVTVDDNLTVTGNLTVSGTTTSINTETLTVDDNIIVLNNNATGAPSQDAGIEIERGSSTNVALRWNETSDKWEITTDGSAYKVIATTDDVSAASVATLDAIGDVTITSASSGEFLKWSGTAWVNDAIDLGTDTTGSYVASLVAGTGITLTNNSGEGATPTVEVNTTVIATLASPTFTGTVTVPTPVNGTDAVNKTYADGVVTAAKIITAAGGDGTAGQALTTNGSGTLDFTTITGTTEASIISAVGGDGSSGQVLKTNGSGDLSFGDVALGTNTTGNYMADVSAGTGISITHTPAEGSTATIALADVSFNEETASYTLVLDDKNKIVEMNVASANNLTIPPNSSVAFPVGSQINILQVGTGQTTIVAGAGVTVNGTPGLKMRTQFSYATCIKRATNTWVLVGDLSA